MYGKTKADELDLEGFYGDDRTSVIPGKNLDEAEWLRSPRKTEAQLAIVASAVKQDSLWLGVLPARWLASKEVLRAGVTTESAYGFELAAPELKANTKP